jgi:hypothetical protein
VERVGVLGNVKVFLDRAAGIGQKRPVGATPLRYSLVSVMLSVLMVTRRQ